MTDSGIDPVLLAYIEAFERETGRLPNIWDLVLYYEARASVKMSHDKEETISVSDQS